MTVVDKVIKLINWLIGQISGWLKDQSCGEKGIKSIMLAARPQPHFIGGANKQLIYLGSIFQQEKHKKKYFPYRIFNIFYFKKLNKVFI